MLMGVAEDAARFRELAAALDVEAGYEVELAAAKAAYRSAPDSDAKARLRGARDSLVAARQARRPEATMVGGDAVGSEG
jgi:hypothetical protein